MIKEIVLIGLMERSQDLLNCGYKIVNYANQDVALEGLRYRKRTNKSMPSIILINGFEQDEAKYRTLLSWTKEVAPEVRFIILDECPTPLKKFVAKEEGADEYMPLSTTAKHIKLQLQSFSPGTTNHFELERVRELRTPMWKRAFDIAFASLALVFLSPIFLATIIAIRLESKGPVFYYQRRVGKGYKIFNFYKFRSMFVNADTMIKKMKDHNSYAQPRTKKISHTGTNDKMLIGDNLKISEKDHLSEKRRLSNQSFVKFPNDPRITRVGKFIRNTSIDELPQLFNVLIGDMSIVGNRPLPLYEAELLTEDKWAERFMGPAGITGLWQVTERSKKNGTADSRKQLDNQYAQQYSLLMDLKILFKTPLAAIQQQNV